MYDTDINILFSQTEQQGLFREKYKSENIGKVHTHTQWCINVYLTEFCLLLNSQNQNSILNK